MSADEHDKDEENIGTIANGKNPQENILDLSRKKLASLSDGDELEMVRLERLTDKLIESFHDICFDLEIDDPRTNRNIMKLRSMFDEHGLNSLAIHLGSLMEKVRNIYDDNEELMTQNRFFYKESGKKTDKFFQIMSELPQIIDSSSSAVVKECDGFREQPYRQLGVSAERYFKDILRLEIYGNASNQKKLDEKIPVIQLYEALDDLIPNYFSQDELTELANIYKSSFILKNEKISETDLVEFHYGEIADGFIGLLLSEKAIDYIKSGNIYIKLENY